MSLSSNYPAIATTLLQDFVKSRRLDPRITFSRASTGTYYNGSTAKAEENLLLQSQDFTTTWAATAVTVTANTTTAPDGTSTAETFDDDVANGVHDVNQNVVTTTGTTYTLSAFLKNVDRQYAILACSGSTTSYASAKFDLSAGTLGSTAGSGAGWSVTSSSITSVGNGWYRCTITFVVGTTVGNAARIGMATDGTTFTASQRGLEVYTGSDKTIFVWGAQLEQRSVVTAYTPTTTQAITNYIPVLVTAASNEPRFDVAPSTLTSLGLLIEESRTNSILQSEDFATTWVATSATVTANAIVAPSGATTGDKLIVDNGISSSSSSLRQEITKAASAITYTLSMFAKKGEANTLRMLPRDTATSANNVDARFNLNDGTVISVTAVGTFTSASGAIQNVGNGWYRCSVTFTSGTEVSIRNQIFQLNDNASFTGNGTNGIYIWGYQFEAGAFATSYIPTTTTALTRQADVASMTGTAFSTWFNATAGTLVVQSQTAQAYAAGVPARASIDDGAITNRIAIRNGNNFSGVVSVSGSSVASLESTAWNSNIAKQAIAYKVDDFAYTTNGASVVTDTSGAIPSVNRLGIGVTGAQNYLNGWLQRLTYYPLRNTNAQLQALTGT